MSQSNAPANGDGQRLAPETVDRFFGSADIVPIPVLNEPYCELRFHPDPQIMELRVSTNDSPPELVGLENINVDQFYNDSERTYCLRVNAKDIRFLAYSFVADVVDSIAQGHTLGEAIGKSIEGYQQLVKRQRRLSDEKQTGLIGELLFLQFLCGHSESAALDAWLGPSAEQHDFSFLDFDVEVKTTKSERRVHRISTATQLEPSVGRVLWFLSVQITAAGSSSNGFSLDQLISQVGDLLGSRRERFLSYLRKLGWDESELHSYPEKYVLRTAPAFYLVDERFPALRASSLKVQVEGFQHLSEISYRTDISHLIPSEPPSSVSEFSNVASALLRRW
ncbi:PD-(D/E)XK motif protein [Neomicrococcus lactis]|uniref:PD-(D/E)XK motif protein n=1 Tax=Neomicrococcus lactis TaxID=732241 RepID=A0A7W8YCC7_9MICC|nr:PD-(D/E)XK motif protein [Neomicrococcus lactis]MBB5598958.1 hypothetical protein [Neomicrococcus lactis]